MYVCGTPLHFPTYTKASRAPICYRVRPPLSTMRSRSILIRVASVPSSSTSSSNQGCFSASRAVMRFFGSYTKILRSRSKNILLNWFVAGMISSSRFIPRTNFLDWRGVSGIGYCRCPFLKNRAAELRSPRFDIRLTSRIKLRSILSPVTAW